MKTDLTFFTNEPGSTLLDRFRKTLKDVRYFDILVGFFRTSGFFNLCQSFETIEKVRIFVDRWELRLNRWEWHRTYHKL